MILGARATVGKRVSASFAWGTVFKVKAVNEREKERERTGEGNANASG